MNLKELKKMISEEYRYWLAEQPIEEPGIEVGPGDVDAMGGGDSEATLKSIYDMLKSYFEGGAGAGEAMPMPAGDDMGDMDAAAMGDDDDMEVADMDGEDEEEEDDKEALQERFKKLANIIKG